MRPVGTEAFVKFCWPEFMGKGMLVMTCRKNPDVVWTKMWKPLIRGSFVLLRE